MVVRKVSQVVTLWIIAALFLAASTSGNIGPIRPTPTEASGRVDPIVAAAATTFYHTDPPIDEPVIVSRPLDRSDVPIDRRIWTVMWLSSTGRLCGTLVNPIGLDTGFCYVDQATALTVAPGRAMSLNFTGDQGFLQAHALVGPGIATVTASTTLTPDQTTTVVRFPLSNGTDLGVFALTLYAREGSLGDITWTFRDAHGSVIATEVTNEWGHIAAA